MITETGISRGAITKAIDEAIDEAIGGGFIICSSRGRPNRSRLATQSASYLLRWDKSQQYTINPQTFQGFYAGEGHRTPIPNALFDRNQTKERLPAKNNPKQQHPGIGPSVVADNPESYLLLREAGFDERTAADLCLANLYEAIKNQIDWLEHRSPRQNQLDLLRRAIEDSWSEPPAVKEGKQREAARQRHHQPNPSDFSHNQELQR